MCMKMQQLCPICDQSITGEEADQERTAAAIFGAVSDYRVCCHCKRTVDEDTQKDPEYRKAWDERARSTNNKTNEGDS